MTSVSNGDLMAIGAALLNVVVAVQQMGHVSPASTLDYMGGIDLLDGDDSAAPLIVRDFIAWTCGREDQSPGCKERLTSFTNESGWYSQTIEFLGEYRNGPKE